MKHHHIWTIGCQMNEADSGRVAAKLDALGYAPTAAMGSQDSMRRGDVSSWASVRNQVSGVR